MRTAVTIVIAGAATGTLLDGTGHAAPGLSPTQVRDQVNTLYREAEAATEKYNGAEQAAEEAKKSLKSLRDEAARKTDRLNSARQSLGSLATAQYRAGTVDPSLQLALSPSPEAYLESSAVTERARSRQTTAIAGVRKQLRDLAQIHAEADRTLDHLTSREAELRRQKQTVAARLTAAQHLLSRLTAGQRARLTPPAPHPSRAALREPSPAVPATAASTTRAAAAVAYAYRALGKPYVWGATGPNAFDCSGLAQAAYRAAGVALPRTTFAQINAGRRVSRSELLPGDLVFFYSGISHVGIYVGGGRMIHAPNPSAPVRLAAVGSMPFAGAARVT